MGKTARYRSSSRFAAATIVAATVTLAHAEVAPELRVKIMLTALGFDRSLAGGDAYDVSVGIYGECPAAESLRLAEGKKINGKPIALVKANEVTYSFLEPSGINVVYLCAIADADVKILAKVAPRLGIVVLADDAALVDSVAVMGVRELDGRPRLRLNMKIAKASRIDFDPRILGNAEVIAE